MFFRTLNPLNRNQKQHFKKFSGEKSGFYQIISFKSVREKRYHTALRSVANSDKIKEKQFGRQDSERKDWKLTTTTVSITSYTTRPVIWRNFKSNVVYK